MDFTKLLNLFGGLALFLYGMNVMSKNMEKIAGGSLEATLRKVTANKFLSFLIGAGITAVIQSSGALIVMVVGLVNSNIIPFSQTIFILLGSAVGTTITSWFMIALGVSSSGFSIMTLLSPKCFVPVFAFVGILMRMAGKKDRTKDIGTILVGFAILMYGMEFMSESMKTLIQVPGFNDVLVMFTNPVVAFIVATIFTGIIQSSSAAIGIFQALALTGAISFGTAIPLILGANVGTCAPSLISAIGASTDAKRVTISFLIIKLVGASVALICLGLFKLFAPIDLNLVAANAFNIAVFHTAFNIANSLMFAPFDKAIVKLVEGLVKPQEGEKAEFLDERLLSTPAVAVNEAGNLVNEMAYIAEEAVLKAMSLINYYDEDVSNTIEVDEQKLDKYEDGLDSFLTKLATKSLSNEDAKRVSRMHHSITNFERLSDHALNIHDQILEMKNRGLELNEAAKEEVKTVIAALSEILDLTVISFINNNVDVASRIEPLEEVIDTLIKEVQNKHIDRLSRNETTLEVGVFFNDILANCERISDYCSNLGVSTIELQIEEFDSHKYLNRIKRDSNEFKTAYEQFKQKYLD